MISNQDRKQIRLMKYLLAAYSKGNVSLRELLTKLDHLARSTIPKAEWKKDFLDNWLNLESFNTESIPLQRNQLSVDELEIFDRSVNNIAQLVDHLLSSYEQVPDISVQSVAQELDTQWLLCPLCIDAWQNNSKNAMVVCPKCNEGLHNPRYIQAT